MKSYDEYFEGYDVPDRLKNTAIAIMQRFIITGLCDGMYICNSIAIISDIGDGCGKFTSDSIANIPDIAKALQSAYGCNIAKDDIEELEFILMNGRLNKEKAICGIINYIVNCCKEKRICDKWRVDYLNRCINSAMETLQSII